MATISSSLASSLLPLLCLLLAAAANQQQEQPTPALPPITLAGCPDKCGNVSIPYPFGTKDGCFRPGFFVVCNDTFDPPRPFINSSLVLGDDDTRTQIIVEDLYYLTSKDHETTPNWSARPIELVSVSLADGKARLLGAFSYECRLNMTHHSVRRQSINFGLNDSPFVLSDADNVLMGIGSNVVAEQTTGPLCQSYLNPNVTYQGLDDFRVGSGDLITTAPVNDRPVNGSCAGQGCCHVNLPSVRSGSKVTIKKGTMYEDDSGFGGGSPVSCSYAMIVEKTWYNFSSVDLDNDAFLRRNAAGVVPVVADFTIDLGGCPEAGEPTPKDFACISDNSECVDRPAGESTGHYCSCSVGYQGNPYIHGGCQDIDECARPDMYPWHGKCKNTPGHYECSCPAGTRGNAKEAPCTDLFSLPAKISVGMVGGLFIIALLVFTILIHNEKRKMTDFFKRNGGPTLEKAKIIKIYKKGELKPILEPSNFIGRGAFGEVYKGFLDNQLVAVKKPIDGNADTTKK